MQYGNDQDTLEKMLGMNLKGMYLPLKQVWKHIGQRV